MLQTWRLNSKGDHETHQRQAFDPETARPIVQQACNSCRVKKLRCSGEKSGCFRCQTLSQDCIYAQNTTRGSARTRKNKESISKIDDGARRSSISASSSSGPSVPTPPTEATPASPRRESFASVSSAPSSELQLASTQSATNQDNTASLDIDIMPFGAQDYVPMPSIPTIQMTGLETYQSSDTWLLPWPEQTQENPLVPAKGPWEGVTVPLSLPSLGGWELGIQGYDETPLTPTTGNIASEPIISDVQMTPLSFPPQTVTSQHGPDDNSYWLHPQTREPCQCLQRVVFLLEEIDSEAIDTNFKELGPWLSRHKEALRCSEALLMCPLCQAKPEHMTILAFLTDRLIAMCDDVVSAYLMTVTGSVSHGMLGPKDGVWVGGFEIDSPHEWCAVVSTMLVMQLRGLETVMARFKDLLRSVGGEGVRRKADSTQSRISALLEKLDPSQQDRNEVAVPLRRSDGDH
ncbi:hypothetical protein F4859DRAFT_481910 [Xylaria cf. heliscus]|nr:hypothetical protein F4859DRAFT_481910 [Xylaria cf. heliscus]